jgi:ribonuclease BN (tRNA processing enzyme)
VKVTLLPSALEGSATGVVQFLTSFLLNDNVCIDAGSLGFFHPLHDQARVRHVLISHTHIDHIASLPVFLENVYRKSDTVVTVHASEPVLECLQRDVFNDRVWPDFVRITKEGTPFLTLAPLRALVPSEMEGLRITPVPVNHVVPTFGFIVEDAKSGVVISSDTGPTDEIWRLANRMPHLQAVFLEVTFPNEMDELADLTKHHTPRSFGAESRKVERAVPFLAYHIKPRYVAQVVRELHELGLPNVAVVQPGMPYSF